MPAADTRGITGVGTIRPSYESSHDPDSGAAISVGHCFSPVFGRSACPLPVLYWRGVDREGRSARSDPPESFDGAQRIPDAVAGPYFDSCGAEEILCIPERPSPSRSQPARVEIGDAQPFGKVLVMLYPELFRSLEKSRWSMANDVPWLSFEAEKLSDEQARSIKMNAITEWSALPATEMFLRDNRQDSDFCAFMSVWFYEEQKHALVLMEYLRRFRPTLAPTEEELHAVRFEFDPAPPLETLMLHFCGEVRLTQWYRCAAEWHTEPVIKHIYDLISKDEARHGGAYLKYMKRAIERWGDKARQAFAKIGVLMASSARSGKPLHPTNLHVAKAHFPRDTVQSRLPDPDWLDRWLSEQIRFDKEWESRVVGAILRNLSALFGETFTSVHELNRFRKGLNVAA